MTDNLLQPGLVPYLNLSQEEVNQKLFAYGQTEMITAQSLLRGILTFDYLGDGESDVSTMENVFGIDAIAKMLEELPQHMDKEEFNSIIGDARQLEQEREDNSGYPIELAMVMGELDDFFDDISSRFPGRELSGLGVHAEGNTIHTLRKEIYSDCESVDAILLLDRDGEPEKFSYMFDDDHDVMYDTNLLLAFAVEKAVPFDFGSLMLVFRGVDGNGDEHRKILSYSMQFGKWLMAPGDAVAAMHENITEDTEFVDSEMKALPARQIRFKDTVATVQFDDEELIDFRRAVEE